MEDAAGAFTVLLQDPVGWIRERVLFSDNDDGLSYSNYYSEMLVKKQHPDWANETQIGLEAERQYNAGAKAFFLGTLKAAQTLRPKGKFGFYEYPMAASKELDWLWSAVGVLSGSDYGRCT